MKLVVAEKPSVAQSLAAVLGAKEKKDGYLEGGGWLVSWCVGHLVELAQPEAYGEQYAKWRYADLPILPAHWKYDVAKDKKKQLGVLRYLMEDKRVDAVVCATDAGREGELIFRLVYQQVGCSKPILRLWISSMEDAAIRDGFEHLRPGADYDLLYLKENYACKKGNPGVILGLQTHCLVDTASQNSGFFPDCAEKRAFKDDFPTAFLRDVLYDECLIKDFIHNAIGCIYTFRNQIGTSHFSLQHFVQTLVDAYRLYFKDSHFDKEKETRLIVDGNTVQNYPDVYSFSSYYTPHPAQDEQKSYLYLYLNDCSLYHVEHVASQICSCD